MVFTQLILPSRKRSKKEWYPRRGILRNRSGVVSCPNPKPTYYAEKGFRRVVLDWTRKKLLVAQHRGPNKSKWILDGLFMISKCIRLENYYVTAREFRTRQQGFTRNRIIANGDSTVFILNSSKLYQRSQMLLTQVLYCVVACSSPCLTGSAQS